MILPDELHVGDIYRNDKQPFFAKVISFTGDGDEGTVEVEMFNDITTMSKHDFMLRYSPILITRMED